MLWGIIGRYGCRYQVWSLCNLAFTLISLFFPFTLPTFPIRFMTSSGSKPFPASFDMKTIRLILSLPFFVLSLVASNLLLFS